MRLNDFAPTSGHRRHRRDECRGCFAATEVVETPTPSLRNHGRDNGGVEGRHAADGMNTLPMAPRLGNSPETVTGVFFRPKTPGLVTTVTGAQRGGTDNAPSGSASPTVSSPP
jgi:hypothetical protein